MSLSDGVTILLSAGAFGFSIYTWRRQTTTQERLAAITNALIARGDAPAIAQTKAIGVLNGVVTQQALMLSFEQLFLLFGSAFVLSLPLLLLMHKSKGGPGGGGGAH